MTLELLELYLRVAEDNTSDTAKAVDSNLLKLCLALGSGHVNHNDSSP
jgi:hypothetical protein